MASGTFVFWEPFFVGIFFARLHRILYFCNRKKKRDYMKKIFSLAILCVFIGCLNSSAEPVEQLLEAFNRTCQVDQANRFFKELLRQEFVDEPVIFAASTPKDSLQQQVWYWAAEWLYDQQQYQQAVNYAQKALPCYHVEDQKADCLNLLAVVNIRLANYEQAAEYAKQCYSLDEKSGDADRMSSSLNTLAAIYMGAAQPKEAETYVLKGIEKAQQANNPGRMAVLQAMASEIYHAMGDDRKALPHIEKAYEIDSLSGRADRATVRLAQKASVLIGLHDYAQAEQVLKRVIPFFRQVGDRQSLGISLNKLGMALLSQKREKEAVTCYREAAEIFTSMGDIYNEVHARKGLYESLWESDPAAAKAELNRFNDLKDSIYSRNSAESLARYNAEFGNNWLQLENHAEHQARQRAIVIGVIVALVLLALAAAIWLVMRRHNRRQLRVNEQLSSDIEQLREKYRELNIHYEDILKTKESAEQAQTDEQQLSEAGHIFIDQTVNIINELMGRGQVDAASVAEQLNMSPYQFRQRMNVLTGETPQTFIQRIRMTRACHLLTHHPELSVSEIAQLCAYNDTPNFTRAFKKAVGSTPTDYREQQTP